MKNHYISAMNKISASDELRLKTLEAMQNAKEQKKPSRNMKITRWAAAAAACVALICVVPAAVTILIGGYSKSASPMQMAGAAAPSTAAQDAQSTKTSVQAPEASLFKAAEGTAGVNKDEAGPRIEAGAFELTLQRAEELALTGNAYRENEEEPGGYEAEGMEILKAEALQDDNGNVYFKLAVKLKSKEELVLIVK